MGDYSVRAILSAQDKNFTSTLRNATNAVDTLGSKLKSGLGMGIMQGMGQSIFNTLQNGAMGLVGEIDSANAAWKTFGGNMKILGKSDKEINKVKKSMQKYAEATIYSSSDMASTYAQLSAVGVKSADKLVTGFGGLAAAAENPTQAMKTLSQQATQMAGKPTVAWADFKLMMEQTPAGIAAVAKEMGMSTSELVKKIQAGEVSTNSFFKAVNKVGNSKGFKKLATEYKTVGQAMGGLKETLANKLLPSFDLLSAKGIKGIEGIIDKVSEIDGEALANKLSKGLKKAQPYFDMTKTALGAVGSALKKVGGFMLEHSDQISKALPWVLGLVAAYKGFKVVNSVAPGMMKFTGSITKLAGKGTGAIAAKLFGIAAGEKAAGTASQASAKQVMAAAKSFLLMGASVLMVSAGFALLAQSAIGLASAGTPAIACMFGMVAAMALLAYGASLIGTALTAGAIGFIAFGAAVLLVGAGVALASVGLAKLAVQLPVIAAYGTQAAGAIVALGAGMTVFAAGSLLAGTASVALGAGLLVATAGVLAFGGGMIIASAGMLTMAGALKLVNSSMKSISKNAKSTTNSLKTMRSSVNVVSVGLDALGSKAKSAMNKLTSAFDNTASKAKSAGQKTGTNFATGMKGGLNNAVSAAKSATNTVNSTLRSGRSGAYDAGAYISKGFALGMRSQLSVIRSAAAAMAVAADKAVRAKAKIHSPSRVSKKDGSYWGEGWIVGIKDKVKDAWRVAEKLVSFPTAATPDLTMAYNGELSSDYSYTGNAEYRFVIPFSIDGREFARAEASYMQEELNKKETRENRKHGRV